MTQDDRDKSAPNLEPWDPTGGAWLANVMPDIMARRAEHEAHAAVCTERPCEQCARFVCRCGKPVDGERECDGCARESHLAELLRPTLDSIPEDFRWVLTEDAAGLRKLSSRTGKPCVGLSEAAIARCLAAPSAEHLYFRGQTGSGKTTLAIAMLNAWVRRDPNRRRGSFFVDAEDLALARREHRLGDGEAPLIERACRAPLLLIDELGGEANDRDGGIKDVVYRRAKTSRPTWVTCGQVVNADDLAFARYLTERYDGGFARRIVELGKPLRLGAPKAGTE